MDPKIRNEIAIRCFAVSLVALRKAQEGHHEVLLMKRLGTLPGEWCQVAGSIEANETAWEAALRELKEETGLVPEHFYSADICEQFYEAERNAMSILPVFAAYVAPDAQVTLNKEHSEYRWLRLEEAIEMVPFAGQRHLLRHIDAEFCQRPPNPLLKIKF